VDGYFLKKTGIIKPREYFLYVLLLKNSMHLASMKTSKYPKRISASDFLFDANPDQDKDSDPDADLDPNTLKPGQDLPRSKLCFASIRYR
jgi:hypothetical protein